MRGHSSEAGSCTYLKNKTKRWVGKQDVSAVRSAVKTSLIK